MEKSSLMTKNEEYLMNYLWESEAPLSCAELVEKSSALQWGDTYILNMLRSLKKKGMVEVCGSALHRTQYARQFRARISRDEYAARMAMNSGIQGAEIGKTALALVKQMEVDEELLQELEAIIEKIGEGQG